MLGWVRYVVHIVTGYLTAVVPKIFFVFLPEADAALRDNSLCVGIHTN
jgi:hypothetical protein